VKLDNNEIFVGRKEELERLSKIFSFSKGESFEAKVVAIEGDPGIGKSKLLEIFGRKKKGIDFLWIYAEQGLVNPWGQLLRELLKLRGIKPERFFSSPLRKLLFQKISRETSLDDNKELFWERFSDELFCMPKKIHLLSLSKISILPEQSFSNRLKFS
jgi:hypothetical protein